VHGALDSRRGDFPRLGYPGRRFCLRFSTPEASQNSAKLNLVQVQKWSFALEETTDLELDLV
jgi:hypothetical protein